MTSDDEESEPPAEETKTDASAAEQIDADKPPITPSEVEAEPASPVDPIVNQVNESDENTTKTDEQK